ncbi:MAG: hypothetical protein PHN37_00115 [Candidatus Pacebacteria bacterium]|nr:hypothetical protein [Candidatus Paceibacterota bacterium]
MDHKKDLKKIELLINQHLYTICSVITILVMLMFLVEFFSKGMFNLYKIELFYLGVLLIYSFHKELIRCIGCKKLDKQGENFVYIWIVLTLSLYIVNFISRDFFTITVYNEPSLVLKNISILTLQILAIFIITRGIKFIKIFLAEKK